MKLRTLLVGTVCFLALGFLRADEFTATLVRVADGKVTFARGAGKKKKEATLPADEKCRITVAKYDTKRKTIEAGDEIADGLKNARLLQLDKEPINAWIRTSPDNEKILEMRLFQATKKK